MKTFLQSIILIIYCLSSHAQRPSFNLDSPRFDSIFSIEKENGGQQKTYNYPIYVSKDYFPNSTNFNLANPIIFARRNNDFDLNISYYFSANDSVIRLIEYSWDLKSSKIKKIDKLFAKNQKALSEHFKYQGTKTRKIKMDSNDWERLTIIWEDESCYVNQFMIKGQGTYRIRVLISWK